MKKKKQKTNPPTLTSPSQQKFPKSKISMEWLFPLPLLEEPLQLTGEGHFS